MKPLVKFHNFPLYTREREKEIKWGEGGQGGNAVFTGMWLNDGSFSLILQLGGRHPCVVGRDGAEVNIHSAALPAVVLHLQADVDVARLVAFALEGELHVLRTVADLTGHGAETQP